MLRDVEFWLTASLGDLQDMELSRLAEASQVEKRLRATERHFAELKRDALLARVLIENWGLRSIANPLQETFEFPDKDVRDADAAQAKVPQATVRHTANAA